MGRYPESGDNQGGTPVNLRSLPWLSAFRGDNRAMAASKAKISSEMSDLLFIKSNLDSEVESWAVLGAEVRGCY
jgi:hypothetical protein